MIGPLGSFAGQLTGQPGEEIVCTVDELTTAPDASGAIGLMVQRIRSSQAEQTAKEQECDGMPPGAPAATAAAASSAVFVPALHIRTLTLGMRDRRQLCVAPLWAADRDRGGGTLAHDGAWAIAPAPHPPHCWLRVGVGPRGLLAWTLNGTLLIGLSAGLVYTVLSRAVLPRTLHASALDEEEWQSTFLQAFVLAMLQSLILIDLLKVMCLTNTSLGGPLDQLVLRRAGCRCLRKPLRRLYKVFDILL